MQTVLDLVIADVAFRFRCEPTRDMVPVVEPLLASFFLDSHCPDPVRVSLRAACMLDTNDLPVWRVSPDGLTWYRDGRDYIVKLTAFQSDDVVWLVRFDPALQKEVIVDCGGRLLVRDEGRELIRNPCGTPLFQILLTYYLSTRRGALHHATGAVIGGRSFLFPARSGVGKSTFATLLMETNCGVVLSDDRVFTRWLDGAFHAFGTPWASDARAAQNQGAPLAAICFLHQAAENRLVPITAQSALEQLLPVTSIPWHDLEVMMPLLDHCGDLLAHVPCFELHFERTAAVCDLLTGI